MRFILLAILMALLGLPAGADDPLARYVDPESLQKLRAGSSVSSSVASEGELRLVPAITTKASIAADVRALRPTVGVEMLRLIPDLAEQMYSPEGWLRIYNALHAVSSMRGITYYSVSRGKMEVLFSKSYAISSASTPTQIADPVFTEIPQDDVLYTWQEDRSFGGIPYLESFQYRTDHLAAKIENLSTISLFIFPLVTPHNLVSHVVVIPVDKDLLFYGVACLRTAMPIGDRHSREESLENRLVAMADWLKGRLSAPRVDTAPRAP
jgi:hypothetical protein